MPKERGGEGEGGGGVTREWCEGVKCGEEGDRGGGGGGGGGEAQWEGVKRERDGGGGGEVMLHSVHVQVYSVLCRLQFV